MEVDMVGFDGSEVDQIAQGERDYYDSPSLEDSDQASTPTVKPATDRADFLDDLGANRSLLLHVHSRVHMMMERERAAYASGDDVEGWELSETWRRLAGLQVSLSALTEEYAELLADAGDTYQSARREVIRSAHDDRTT